MNTDQNNYFFSQGFISSGFLNFTPRESFTEAKENAIILDVREEYLTSYKQFGVDRVMMIPFSVLNTRWDEIPRDTGVIIADATGLKSKEAILFLLKKEFRNIANLAGGLVEWERDGLPINKDKYEQLDGGCPCQLKPINKLKKYQ